MRSLLETASSVERPVSWGVLTGGSSRRRPPRDELRAGKSGGSWKAYAGIRGTASPVPPEEVPRLGADARTGIAGVGVHATAERFAWPASHRAVAPGSAAA